MAYIKKQANEGDIKVNSKSKVNEVTDEKETVNVEEKSTKTEKIEKVEKNAKRESKTFEQNELVQCRSIVSGPLYLTGIRSGIPYTWADYNDVQGVEYRDLIYMVRSTGNKYVYSPRIIVEDEDFIAQNKQLSDLYDSMYTTVDLKDIVKLPVRTMVAEINRLPAGAKESFKGIVSTMIYAHELDSVQKIKAIDEVFGTKLLLTLAQE